MTIAPYGSWKSPITTDLIVSESIGLGGIVFDGDDVYWIEARPSEAGRCVIVRRTPDGLTTDVNPPPFNARTRVHEYGGGAFLVDDGTVYFSNDSDQRVYCQRPGETPQPLTPVGEWRYADGVMDRKRRRIICVREDHSVAGREAVNTLVSINLSAVAALGERGPISVAAEEPRLPSAATTVLMAGNDFYSSPRVSPDGARLAWLTWNHPNMPWDGTELWVGDFDGAGQLVNKRLVAGGASESIFQPEWSPDGALRFVSDRTGWWNLYRLSSHGEIEPLCPIDAEFGQPQWVFGMSTYAFVSAGQIVCAFKQNGLSCLALLDTATRQLDVLEVPYTEIGVVRAAAGRVLFLGGSPTEPVSVVSLDLATRRLEVVRRSFTVGVDRANFSIPRAIEFPTENGRSAHAFFYAPRNADFVGVAGERPPLLVISHGGPTGATSASFSLTVQYWTSRGFAVADVNYGGSTGYGRAYRERLNGQWGIVDVDDCCNAARYLVERGEADGARLIIRGGSAGGYTTLCALTFRDVFKAGASYYGISDLEASNETHKFESRYNFSLVAPWPQGRDVYRARSPLCAAERLNCPIIFFQGLEDKIVLPNQSEMMVEAMRRKGLPVAYLAYEDEQHGFRKATNIKRSLEAELYFYSRVFGFDLVEPVEPVEIDNL